MNQSLVVAFFAAITFCFSVSAGPQVSLSSDKKDCICSKGEMVCLTIKGEIPETGVKILMYQPNRPVKTLELPGEKTVCRWCIPAERSDSKQ